MTDREKKPLNIEIGRHIRAAREQSGISREKLAEYADITPRFLADIERGSVGVSVSTLKRICEVLHVSSDSILWNQTIPIGLDDRLKKADVDRDCLEVIERMVENQIELIELVKNKNT